MQSNLEEVSQTPIHHLALTPATIARWAKLQAAGKSHWLKPVVILCCMVNVLSAATYGKFTYTDNGTFITITDYPTTEVGAVEIPASIISKPVTTIGSSAFRDCTSLTSVTIPSGVTSIGAYAFSGCSGLTNITIPSSVTNIAMAAFYGCTKLTTVTIPSGVTSIVLGMFDGCTRLESVTIPTTVTRIETYAFRSCHSLTSVTIPSSVTSIESSAFYGCSSLTNVTIPSSVTSIASSAFQGCTWLTSVTIPSSVTSIGTQAFSDCTGLTSISISSGITSLGDSMFEYCTGLTSVTIPPSVTDIGTHAFCGCAGLRMVHFLGNAPSMGGNVFSGTASAFTVYYVNGNMRFTTPTWNGYPAYPVIAPQFTSALPETGEFDTPYSHTCKALGMPAPTFAVTSGALPTGLTLSSEGIISGTPGVRGRFSVIITASNGITSDATQKCPINILEHHALITAGSNGTVAGGGSYLFDATATLTATPDPGYIFTGWAGDASGSANPLSVPMDVNKTITANFVPDTSDADRDGLSAYLELGIYGTNPALNDTDSDGLTDAWEVGLGRFSIVPGSFTWEQARADAHARGGELACFPTVDRWNRAMESLGAGATDNFVGLWIGASDATTEGTWTWVNGEPFTFTNWATTRPSTSSVNSLDYAELSGGGGAELDKWYDRTATFIRDGYILETGYATDPTNADVDGDGLNDGAEQTAGTNPSLPDTDGDGLTDGQEVNIHHTNPNLTDSDGDGFSDGAEVEFGGNPLIAAVAPEFMARIMLAPATGTLQLSFPAQQGMTYTVRESIDLEHWNDLEANIMGQGAVVTRFYSTENQPMRYFRVRRN